MKIKRPQRRLSTLMGYNYYICKDDYRESQHHKPRSSSQILSFGSYLGNRSHVLIWWCNLIQMGGGWGVGGELQVLEMRQEWQNVESAKTGWWVHEIYLLHICLKFSKIRKNLVWEVAKQLYKMFIWLCELSMFCH